jgi:hypothetical protein
MLESCFMPAALCALERFSINAETIELITHAEAPVTRVQPYSSGVDGLLRCPAS